MKISNKISSLTIGSILLIANTIPIGRYLSEKQATNDAIKATTISSKKASQIGKGNDGSAKSLPNNKLSNTSIPLTTFIEIGPTTNIKIKLTGPAKLWGMSMFIYFLKYKTWEKKLIIRSNGTVMPMWTAVSHEVRVGGDDSKNIEVAGTKIADTEVRIKGSHAGWAKMSGNKDLKWPKRLKGTLANTTYSIDSLGTIANPKIFFYFHILNKYYTAKVASYDVFSFKQWFMNHLFIIIASFVALCIVIISIILTVGTFGTTIPFVTAGDAAIAGEILADDAALAEEMLANIPITAGEIFTNETTLNGIGTEVMNEAITAAIVAGNSLESVMAALDDVIAMVEDFLQMMDGSDI